jgi:hypothetical protein
VQFLSQAESNYTVSNVWVGTAASILPATLTSQGDYNGDGIVDSSDYVVWRNSMDQTGASLAADGNGDYHIDANDLGAWRRNFGNAVVTSGLASAVGVPEPNSLMLLIVGAGLALARGRR